MRFYAGTDKGKLREHNEDSCVAKSFGEYTLFILADGMGGHRGGKTASAMAIDVISEEVEKKLQKKMIPGQIMLLLSEAYEKANEKILEAAKESFDLSGMGTTCDVCLISGNTLYIAHIGDSRIYKISQKGEAVRLTKDHSLVEYMLETGAITPQQALNHPQKNVITRALGIETMINPDIHSEKLSAGDSVLMCSDGLTNVVSDELLAECVAAEDNPEKATENLIRLANEAGGPDNITVIISKH